MTATLIFGRCGVTVGFSGRLQIKPFRVSRSYRSADKEQSGRLQIKPFRVSQGAARS